MFGRRLYDIKNHNEETGEITALAKEQVTQKMKSLQGIVFPAIEAKTLKAIKAPKTDVRYSSQPN
ncbi:hypothetical protein A0J61_10779 [Choanephora cucurbitarum]|uniref:Uncharacterized protein n=1 Tax=Choanephora cucurbitarum TaxID=101091 RepID=A0A1C7MWJ1_9FUNG|nr:hypothetical protein A0J61_10779 [Choanephora cucurbitarum]